MDSNLYLSSLEYFLDKMQSSKNTFSDEAKEALTGVCRILRIGTIKSQSQNILYGSHIDPKSINYFYTSENSSSENPLEFQYATLTENMVSYLVYPLKDQPEWTDTEKRRIKNVCDMMFVFNGRTKIIEISTRLAFYDPEFNVHNLKYFHKFLDSLILKEKIHDYSAVNFNLKHLNILNSRIGRSNCTKVMKKYIGLLSSRLSDEEGICRLGGDNFAAIVKNDNLPVISELLLGADIDAHDICGETVRMAASVGLYRVTVQQEKINSGIIMDRVHVAMNKAKRSAKPQIVEFDHNLFEQQKRASDIAAAFDNAILNKEFTVYYQPKVKLKDYTISGAEALCRWFHEGQMISPGVFISVLEQGNDICRLDYYMLESVCIDIRRWIDTGIKPVRISVNLSRRHLKNPDLVSDIVEIVEKYSVPHELIELELTETINEVEFNELQKTISSFRKNGFATSVDDFGTGYSSLNLIKEIPWSVLKLDKSLLPARGAENIWQDRVLFKYIVAMAQEMGLECVAEGVETMEQLQLLAENNCEMAQGFFFDKPMCVEDFDEKLKDKSYTI